jgi:chromosome segregation ATPase
MSDDPLAEFLSGLAIQEENRRTAERKSREAQEVADRQRREAQQAEEARAHAARVHAARQHLGRYNEVIREASRWLTEEEVNRQRRKLAYLLQDVESEPSGVAGAADILREALEEAIEKARRKKEEREAQAQQQKEDREAQSNQVSVFVTWESLQSQLQKELAEVDSEATLYTIRYAGPSSEAIAEAYKKFVKEWLVKSYNSKLHEQLKDNPWRWMARNFTL